MCDCKVVVKEAQTIGGEAELRNLFSVSIDEEKKQTRSDQTMGWHGRREEHLIPFNKGLHVMVGLQLVGS